MNDRQSATVPATNNNNPSATSSFSPSDSRVSSSNKHGRQEADKVNDDKSKDSDVTPSGPGAYDNQAYVSLQDVRLGGEEPGWPVGKSSDWSDSDSGPAVYTIPVASPYLNGRTGADDRGDGSHGARRGSRSGNSEPPRLERYKSETGEGYHSNESSKKSRCCSSRVGVIVAVILVLLVVGGAAALTYYLVGVRNAANQKSYPVLRRQRRATVVNVVKRSAGYTGSVKASYNYTEAYEDPSSPEYRNLTEEFTVPFAAAMSETKAYNYTKVLNFLPGSVDIIFYVNFRESLQQEVAESLVKMAVNKVSHHLPLAALSLGLTGYRDTSPCSENLTFCDVTRACLHGSRLCNGRVDCPNLVDEPEDCVLTSADPSSQDYLIQISLYEEFFSSQLSIQDAIHLIGYMVSGAFHENEAYHSTFSSAEAVMGVDNTTAFVHLSLATPLLLRQVIGIISPLELSPGSGPGSATVTAFNPTRDSICGGPTMSTHFLCDGRCHLATSVRCNQRYECSDWSDEYLCGGDNPTCNFDSSDCGYTPEVGISGPAFIWSRVSDSTAAGSYFSAVSDCSTPGTCLLGQTTTLISPLLLTIPPKSSTSSYFSTCMSFSYRMSGRPGPEYGALYILLHDQQQRPLQIWSTVDSAGPDWVRARVSLPMGTFTLSFVATWGGSDTTEKAIDDIRFVDPIECEPACPHEEFCPLRGQCVPIEKKCDGVVDCPDGSDEQGFSSLCKADFCSFPPDGYAQCGFDFPRGACSFCWMLLRAYNPKFVVWHDSTNQDGYGLYAGVDFTNATQGDSAILKMPVADSRSPICLSFQHHFYAFGITSTNSTVVRVVQYFNNPNRRNVTLWVGEPSLSDNWEPISTSVPDDHDPYSLGFEVIKGSQDSGSWAIDDVSITPGLCQCTLNRFKCPHDTKCLPNEWQCDGEGDCEGHVDERSCGVCAVGEFTCHDLACVPGGTDIICDGFYDCEDGTDEKECAYTGDGTLKFLKDGEFLEVCYSDWPDHLNAVMCEYLGLGFSGEHAAVSASGNSSQFLHYAPLVPNDSRRPPGLQKDLSIVGVCPGNKNVVRINCERELCGQPVNQAASFIIGGVEIGAGRWPWVTSIQQAGFGHHCGGALINEHWVLSAAHCFENPSDNYQVVLGAGHIDRGEAHVQVIQVEKIVIFPEYKPLKTLTQLKGGDAALLLLSKPAVYNQHVRPICMPAPDRDFSQRASCYVAGWGLTQYPSTSPTQLMEAKMKVFPMDACNTTWAGVLTDSMVCAGYPTNTVRTCSGDSGGLLFCRGATGRYEAHGVLSFGPSKCEAVESKADVYTRVVRLYPWLDDVVQFEFQCTNGLVIRNNDRLCDGVDDCGDESDERLACVVTPSCEFESPHVCGWERDRKIWKRVSGGVVPREDDEDTVRPLYDHTTGRPPVRADGKEGGFMRATSAGALTTPMINTGLVGGGAVGGVAGESAICVGFYYYAFGLSHRVGSLSVRRSCGAADDLGNCTDGMELWSSVRYDGAVWTRVLVDAPSGNYSLSFISTLNPTDGSDTETINLFLDDVTISPGPCSLVQCPFPGRFACSDGTDCIPAELKCDGMKQCSDGSDETLCKPTEYQGEIIAECTFEEAYSCGVRQASPETDEFDWVLFKNDSTGMLPGEAQVNMGPPGGYGHYLLSVTTKGQDVSTEPLTSFEGLDPEAVFEWRVRTVSGPTCLSFQYHMFGSVIGSLEVYPGVSRSAQDVVWEAIGTQLNGWRSAVANVSAGVDSFVFISRVRGANHNHIAVDNLTLTSGPCGDFVCPSVEIPCGDSHVCTDPKYECDTYWDCPNFEDEACSNSTVSCDFELGDCEYYQSEDRRAFFWRRMVGRNDVMRPPNSAGYYFAIRGFLAGDGNTTTLLSPPISSPMNESCLSFRYYVADVDASNPSELAVVVQRVFFQGTVQLWRGRRRRQNTGSVGSSPWQQGHVTLPAGRIQAGFLGIYGGSPGGVGLSVDNVIHSEGACAPLVCSAGQHMCRWEEICLEPKQRCDGTYDCIDQSDEEDCSALASCDFESPGLCSWLQSPHDQLDWEVHQGPSHSLRETGPSWDHTRENILGHYLVLPSGRFQDSAALGMVKGDGKASCMTFYYHMVGRDIARLDVIANTSVVLSIRGTQFNQWKIAKVNLPSGAPYNLLFVGHSGGSHGHIGIDDITFTDGVCDCSDMYPCSSGECFEKAAECDFLPHCLNEDDESDQCPCPVGAVRCPGRNNTCVNKEAICLNNDRSCHLPGSNFSLNCDCRPHETQCKYGTCYDQAFEFCNQVPFCPDGDDEPANCTCRSNQFTCVTGECIPETYYCDGYENDCYDNSDEPVGCVPSGAPTHTCASSAIIPGVTSEITCDGIDNCDDGSDETRSPTFTCNATSGGQLQIILREQYCDGTPQCHDNSDEPDVCKCCRGEFKCHRSNLCILQGAVCNGIYDCGDGSDEKDCTCGATQFQCDDGLCIDESKACNRELDCRDRSDEKNCQCSVSEFRCSNSLCIPVLRHCDGFDDCRDGSDEAFCSCLPGELSCGGGSNDTFHCIPPEWSCDGYKDCPSGHDELTCDTCSSDQFTCSTDYGCVNQSSRCDGHRDCRDGTDETDCVSRSPDGLILLEHSGNTSHVFCASPGLSGQQSTDWLDWLCEEMGGTGAVSSELVASRGNVSYITPRGVVQGLSLSSLEVTTNCSSVVTNLQCHPRVCGSSTKNDYLSSSFIIGGEKVSEISEWPWSAALYYNGEFTGGATLINDRWLLTAAHLIMLKDGTRRDRVPHHFGVSVGSLNRSTSDSQSPDPRQYIRVKQIILHNRYTTTSGAPANDLALIQLERPVRQGRSVRPLCLPQELAPPASDPSLCYLTGWGYINTDGFPADFLREVKMIPKSSTSCANSWNIPQSPTLYDQTSMMCAGYDSITIGGCFGDSGGGLSCLDEHGRWHLQGIMSFGDVGDCRQATKPNVFTRTEAFLPWILSNVT